ncbi:MULTISPECIES: hypothetical protein [unclassified Streptosporangium]|uniref:hypothetical protein n=1 Tax=unclassified Streptosporangium TaxID=2632669 RepID=UPI002E2DB9F4|nr:MULTISPECIES: hypothetical protein [unclassified Streptosporangium]
MMRRTITLAAVAGAVVLAAQLPASATSAVSSASSTALLRLRGGLTLEIPSSWRVYGTADQVRVVTGACARPNGGYFQTRCDSFWVMGPKAIKTGAEGFGRYNPDQSPFYPASDVQRCPTNPKYGQVIGKAIVVGYRNIGVAHKAHYRVWPGRCVSYTDGGQKSTFNQREWYLPKTKILVVDQWATPGLSTILKNATWAN